jgi:hypothetical protein
LSGISPGREPGYDVELAEEAADNLVGIGLGAQSIQFAHHLHERLLDIVNGILRIVLALLFEAALALDEFLAVEIGKGMENLIVLRPRVGQEA